MGGIEAYFRLKFPAPRGLPPHLPEPAITLERLRRLLALLDRWLDSPVRVRRDARGHTAWVAGALGYRVDVASRSVYPVFHRDCGFASGDFRVNLLDYLRTPDWLECVMLKAGLAASGPQARLFSPSPESDHGDGNRCAWHHLIIYDSGCIQLSSEQHPSMAVGTALSSRPPHGSVRASLTHTALTSSVWLRSVSTDTDAWSRVSGASVGSIA